MIGMSVMMMTVMRILVLVAAGRSALVMSVSTTMMRTMIIPGIGVLTVMITQQTCANVRIIRA